MVPLSLLFIAFSEGHGLGAMGIFQGWQWLLLPATGVVTAVPMMLFSAGVKGVPITTGGMLMYLSPSITLVIGLLSGETIKHTPVPELRCRDSHVASPFRDMCDFQTSLQYSLCSLQRKPLNLKPFTNH